MRKIAWVLVFVFCLLNITFLPIDSVVEASDFQNMIDIIGSNLMESTHYDFSTDVYTGVDKNVVSNAEFGSEKGLVLGSGKDASLRIVPSYWWSPISDGNILLFRAKVEDQSQVFMPLWQGPAKAREKNRAGVSISAAGVSKLEGSLTYLDSGFVPGTEWVDYLLKADSVTQWSLYAKSDGSDGWLWVAQGEYGKNGGERTGLYLSGEGCVKEAGIYRRDNAFASQYHLDMNSDFDENLGGVTAFGEGTVEYSDDNGLVLSSGAEWKYLPESGWSALSDGKMVAFRFKIPGNGKLNFQVSAPDTSLKRRVYVDIMPSTIAVHGNSSHSGLGSSTPSFSFAHGNDWIDCLVKANGNDSYSFYLAVDGVWKHYTTTAGYTDSGGAANIGTYFYAYDGDVYLKNIRILDGASVDDSSTKPSPEMQAYYAEEFVSVPQYQNYSMEGNASFHDGILRLDEPASFDVGLCGIPINGYVEFKIKSNSAKNEVVFYDGVRVLSLAMYGANTSVNGVTIPVVDSGNVWRIWRIVKNANGTFDGYLRSENEEAWYPAFQGVAGIGSATEKGFSMEQFCHPVSDVYGFSDIDYIRVYGPSTGKEMVLTDGGGGSVVADNGKVRYPHSLCAVIEPNTDIDRKLIFAEYNGEGNMVNVNVHDIPKGEVPVSAVYSLESETGHEWQIKAFLWDGFSKLTPMEKYHTVNSGELSWNDAGWTYGGTVAKDGGVIYLDSASFAENELSIGSQFELSWTMSLDTNAGGNSVVVSNGVASATLNFTSTGISYLTSNGNKSVSYDVGTKKASYRIVGNGNNWDFYIDGNLVSDMDALTTSSEYAKIRFETAGTNSAMSIYEVSTGVYDSLNNPTYTQGFDAGDMSGWSQTKVYPVSEDVGYDFWFCQDDMLKLQNRTVYESRIKKSISVGDDFIFEGRIRFEDVATWFALDMNVKGHYLELEMRKEFFTLVTPVDDPATGSFQAAYSDELNISPDQWYNLRIESYNQSNNVRIYLDDKLIMEEELPYSSKTTYTMEFYGFGCADDDCKVQIDWIRYVTLSAQMENSFSLPSTGASATVNAIRNGDSISASLSNTTSFESVASVSYYLDGKAVAAVSQSPYQANLTNVSAENHILEAVGRNAAGIVVARASKEIPAGSMDGLVNYSNEIYYTVSGDGTAEFSNGNHKVKMQHSASSVTYLTDTGDKTYQYGTGKFHIITDGPIAEVYRNGQFAFSYYMPSTTDVGKSFSSGITDASASATPERKNYFVARNVTAQNNAYELAELSAEHNLDFVAGADDSASLSVNDGYYRTKVSVENGKLYIWDAAKKNSVPKKTLVETVTADAYYRVETSGGMSRLYKNGRWLSTFRGENSVGSAYLSVQVTQGTLSYLSVNDSTDVYIYEDDFSGNGEVPSLDFWRTQNLTKSLQNNTMVLDATGKTNAIAELYASSGDFDLSAKVKISSVSTPGGFWFLLNHSTTNTYTRVGFSQVKQYFTTKKQYEITDRIYASDVSGGATTNGSLPLDQTVQLDLQVRQTADGEKITLLVNGSEVISKVGDFERYGKVGFMLSNCIATIEEVSYRGNARPVPGVKEKVFGGETVGTDSIGAGGMRDLLELDNGDIYMITHAGGLKTSDGGDTWTPVVSTSEIGITSTSRYGWSRHMLRLQNGKYLSVGVYNYKKTEYNKQPQDYYICISDDGLHWSDYNFTSPLFKEKRFGTEATVNALKQGPSGRVYFTNHEGISEDVGSVVVWYSDNNGKNWTHSITIRGEEVGHVLAEAQVVETETSTRLYFRNEKGYLCYYTSPDRGKTWDLTHLYKTPLLASLTCYNIENDPDNPNTIYVGWEYDNLNLFGRPQWPSTRWGVAKSTDGGNTWEYLGTVNENNYESRTSSNLSLNVSKDYVILNADSRDDDSGSNEWRARLVMIPKDTAKTSKRFEQLHYQYDGQIENTQVIPEERFKRTMAIHSASGMVLLHGERVENAANGVYLSRDVAETFLGSSLSVSGDALTTIDGRQFVSISAFADAYGLSVVDENGVKIISENDNWSERQKKAIQNTVNMFS